ncbi:hypothetical protein RJ639_028771 [Escallonia herrerae]|uniref:RING-type domain-containing protein n=1 Tax=Escallonia herrerae TaxID=1293975 RepID=A0AA89BQL9_9ASTE|nr:hypothetical protein RJ639_028771 [Escallonia herrerae]
MPAQKRPSPPENLEEEESLLQHCRRKQSRRERQAQEGGEGEGDEDEDEEEQQLDDGEEQAEEGEDEEDEEEEEEGTRFLVVYAYIFLSVQLMDVRKDVQCPICLGIIKKTRTVMECMHRFCRECIDKSMRLGNNECPACRTHCASRRSLRDDPRYDTLIELLYPDIEKSEEEELTFHEEEVTRNKQIQATIAQISRRQSEALIRKRAMGKETATASTGRLPRSCRNAYARRKTNRSAENHGSDDNEDENEQDGNRESSSIDERVTEIKPRKYKRRTSARRSQPPPSAANSDVGCVEHETDTSKERRGTSPGILWSTERLAWGRGGARSHTRHGSGSSSKGMRSTRLSKLVDYLQNLQENDNELDEHLVLVSLDNQTPSLQQPHLCCRSSLSVKHLCEYVAHETTLQAEDVELLLVKETTNTNGEQSMVNIAASMDDLNSLSEVFDRCKVGLQTLEGQETLASLKATSRRDQLVASSCWNINGGILLALPGRNVSTAEAYISGRGCSWFVKNHPPSKSIDEWGELLEEIS